jgi:TfoX/Sxy family transcriptional regulator of competence genes
MGELENLPNIGKVIEKQLNEIGIFTIDELIESGSKEVWLAIKEIDDSACYNRLCGLEGAIQGIRWHDLSQKDKENLKEFYNSNN